MEIDDTLKNRLAGVAVVTVLAVIFLPMMFDDPVEKKTQIVSELDIPRKPEVSPLLTTAIVPDKNSTVATSQSKPATVDTSTESTEDLAGTAKKSNTDVDLPLDSEVDDQEDEAPLPVKKATPKKAIAKQAPPDESFEDSHVSMPAEKKTVKTVAEKKPSKAKLPVLNPEYQDKKVATAIPRLDSPPPTLENRRWVVQVASLSDETKATTFRDKLREQGFPASVESVLVKGKRVYRLKVGPELDSQKAQATRTKINQLHNVQSIAIPE